MPELPQLPPIADQPLSVVLLARNCADHVVAALITWLGFLDGIRPGAYELILVDDGSDDGTADKAQAQADAFPALRVIRHEKPQGEGAALRAGLEAATRPLVFYTLCQPEYRPDDLGKLLARTIKLEEGGVVKEIDHVHLMTGFRAGIPVPLWMRILSWFWWLFCYAVFSYSPRRAPGRLGVRRTLGWLLARTLFGVCYRDSACPFRLWRRDILARIPIQSKGPFAHVELVAKANFLACMMAEELPLDVKPPPYRGDAKEFIRDGRLVF